MAALKTELAHSDYSTATGFKVTFKTAITTDTDPFVDTSVGTLTTPILAVIDHVTNKVTVTVADTTVKVTDIKLYADGALGSRGAKLIEPYTDDTLNDGILIVTMDSIVTWAKACYASDFQLNVHCIGDLANRHTLDAMGRVLGGTNDRRWRIEHAQVVHPKDRSKYGAFNIIPSMQPTHATSDMYWAKDRLGGVRIHHAYTLKSLMDENGLIALGTDFPVEGISPLGTFYAAVAQKDPSGYPEDGFLFDEALSREEALRGVTIWAALANFDDSTRGSIEVGKFADFVLLDRDLLKCETASILSTTVLKTWLNGELVHE